METNFRSAILENPPFCTTKATSLLRRWHLVGYDGNINVSLSDVTFTNSSGSQFTWANALANNKVQAYLSYYDSSSATASERKFKYAGLTGVDDSLLRGNKGYWLYANEAGNLTLPDVGGSVSTESYVWNKLRFFNGTEEKSISEAGSAGWVESTIQYHDTSVDDFRYVCAGTGKGYSSLCLTTSLNPWQGYFVNSLQDNITLIRQN